MRIKNIHLSDYKRFTDLTIADVPESARLVVLIGPNGSGKSSLFDAFLVKSWGLRKNYSLGDRQYEGYYNKSSHRRDSSFQLAESITIKFHTSDTLTRDQWSTAFNIRSAYRNEADFRLDALQVVAPSHESPRFQRIIDPDQSVSDNYRRLAWKRMSDIDRDAPGGTTFDQYRREALADIQTAMRKLFASPTLELQDFGGVQDAGVFRLGLIYQSYHK